MTARPTRRRLPTILIALTLALAGVVSTQLPASASGVTYEFIAKRMYGKVTVTFTSKYAFKTTGYIKDVCPADGEGVYAYASALLKNGEKVGFGSIAEDTDGCGNGKVAVFPYGFHASSAKIDNAYVTVCRGSSSEADRLCITKVWDNPKVAG